MTKPSKEVLVGMAMAAFAVPSPAAVPAGFTDSLVAAVGAPTDVAFTPDGRMLVTSQGGTLRVFDQAGALLGSQTLPAGQICSNSERGLLGVAVDPDHSANRYVYLVYTRRKPGGDCGTASPVTSLTAVNRVSRFTLPASNVLDLGSEVVLIDEMPSPAGNHNAGDLAFDRDGYLYVSIGDGGCDYAGGGCGGANDASRDENVLTGKVLRVCREFRREHEHPRLQSVPGAGLGALRPHRPHRHAGQDTLPGDLDLGLAQSVPPRGRPERDRHPRLHQRRRPKRA